MIDINRVQAWQKSIEDFVINDIKKVVDKDNLEVGLIILCLISVDCLGGYLAGKESEKKTFLRFIHKYFPSKYREHSQLIWEMRCGLVHDYILKQHDGVRIIMNRDIHEHHLVWCRKNETLWFNRKKFALDCLEAWDKFLSDVNSNQLIYSKVSKRFDALGALIVTQVDCEDANPS